MHHNAAGAQLVAGGDPGTSQGGAPAPSGPSHPSCIPQEPLGLLKNVTREDSPCRNANI